MNVNNLVTIYVRGRGAELERFAQNSDTGQYWPYKTGAERPWRHPTTGVSWGEVRGVRPITSHERDRWVKEERRRENESIRLRLRD